MEKSDIKKELNSLEEKYNILMNYCDWLEEYIVYTTNISDGIELYKMYLSDMLVDDMFV